MTIFDISVNLFESFTIMLFIFLLYGKEHRYKYFLLTIFTLLSFCLVTYNDNYPIDGLLFDCIDVLLCYIYINIVHKEHIILNLFIAFLPSIILSITSSLCLLIVNSLYKISFNNPFDIAIFATISRILFFITIIFSVRLFQHIKFFNKKLTLYATISFLSLAILYSKIFDSIFLKNTTLPILYFEILLITVLALFIIMIFKESKKEQERIVKQQLVINELNGKEELYKDINIRMEETSKIKHDLKHILHSVSSCLEENNVLQAKTILDNQIENIYSIGKYISTGNNDLDYILNKNYPLLQEQEIELNVSDFSTAVPVEKVDFFIFMGNLIDNAIENCQDNPSKKIMITNGIVSNYYFIKIQNTISFSVLKENPNLETTKNNKSIHGIGIRSTYQLLTKYDAKLDFSEDSMYFTAKIIIPIKDTN